MTTIEEIALVDPHGWFEWFMVVVMGAVVVGLVVSAILDYYGHGWNNDR